MNSKSYADEKLKQINKNFNFQRWFYSTVGFLTIFVIILLTFEQMRIMKKDNHEFAFCLLIVVNSGLILLTVIGH